MWDYRKKWTILILKVALQFSIRKKTVWKFVNGKLRGKILRNISITSTRKKLDYNKLTNRNKNPDQTEILSDCDKLKIIIEWEKKIEI